MRRFTEQFHRVISATLTFFQRLIEKVLPARQQPMRATVSARTTPRRSRLRGVHAVPLVAILALGATAFAVNTDATPTQEPIAVGDQIPHSTPSTTAPGESDAEVLAKVEKLAQAEEEATVKKKFAEKKAEHNKIAREKAEAAAEKAAAEKAEAEKAEAARTAATPEPAPQTAPEPESQPVSASGACGGSLPPCCVMMRESGGSPTVVNSSSGAAGKWQFMTSTWANYGGYATASQAPEHIQDERAAQLWAGGAGAGHWGGGC